MGAPHITASSLARIECCPASATLPRIRRRHDDAEAGTAAHALLAAEAAPGTAEVGFVLDVAAGKVRECPPRDEDGYPEQPGTIPGTADLFYMEGDLLCVDDHKTGHAYLVAPAKDNLQLQFYALCASLFVGISPVRIRILNAEGVVTSEALLDAFDLDGVLDRVRRIWARATAEKPKLVAGYPFPCWRCECVDACPAHQTALVVMGTGKLDGVLTTEAKVASIAAAAVASRVLKNFRAAIYASASVERIDLGNGMFFGDHPTETRVLDATIVRQTLRDMFGADVADAACDFETSQAAIERALRPIWLAKKAAGEKVSLNGKAGVVTKAIEAIAARNGIRTIKGKKVGPYKPGAPALEEGESDAA